MGLNSQKHLEIFALHAHSTGKNIPSLAVQRVAEERRIFLGLRLQCFVILLERTLFPCLRFNTGKILLFSFEFSHHLHNSSP